jgi:hypothetical protein
MRIPGTKVWRAFHELDPFDDERCRMFVRAASRPMARVIRACAVVLVAVVVAYVWLRVVQAMGYLGIGSFGRMATWGLFAWAVALAVPGPIAGVLTRDLMLKRAIRRVLRSRGSCIGCGYGLIGLRAGGDGKVTCPECGVANDTDEAMQSLVAGGDDGGTKRPAVSAEPVPARVAATNGATARRGGRRVLVWGISLLAIAVVVSGASAPLWWRSVLRADAADLQYVLSRVPSEQRVLVLAGAPMSELSVGTIGGNLDEQSMALQQILLRGAEPGEDFTIRDALDDELFEFPRSAILAGGLPDDPELSVISLESARERFQRVISEYRQIDEFARNSGLANALDRFASQGLQLSGASIISSNAGGVHSIEDVLRGVMLVHRARASLAVQRGDFDEAVRAVESGLRMATFAGMQPSISTRTETFASMCDAFEEAREILMLELSDEQFNRVSLAVRSARSAASTRRSWVELMEAELSAIIARRTAGFDRAAIASSAETWEDWWDIASMPTGSGRRSFAAVDELMDGLRPWLDASGALGVVPMGLVRNKERGTWFQLQITGALEAAAVIDFEFAVLEAMLRIETFRRAAGRLPTSLDEADGAAKLPVIVDPIGGVPFVYRVGTPGQDGMNTRGYVLYSVGGNGVDDGGESYREGRWFSRADNVLLLPDVRPGVRPKP